MEKDLDYYLQEIAVMEVASLDNGLKQAYSIANMYTWYAVANEEGIIAYFTYEVDALRFRLDYINRKLNP